MFNRREKFPFYEWKELSCLIMKSSLKMEQHAIWLEFHEEPLYDTSASQRERAKYTSLKRLPLVNMHWLCWHLHYVPIQLMSEYCLSPAGSNKSYNFSHDSNSCTFKNSHSATFATIQSIVTKNKATCGNKFSSLYYFPTSECAFIVQQSQAQQLLTYM